MTVEHFKSSNLGDVQRYSQVEARYATVTGLAHRTGFDHGVTPTGRVTISGWNEWVEENADRDRFLAKPIARAKKFIGPDYKPMIGSATYGVNRSARGDIHDRAARGAPARVMQPGDTAQLPDPRNSFGHNAHMRIARVRGAD